MLLPHYIMQVKPCDMYCDMLLSLPMMQYIQCKQNLKKIHVKKKKAVHILSVSNIMFMFTVKQQHSSHKVGHKWTENDEEKRSFFHMYICI